MLSLLQPLSHFLHVDHSRCSPLPLPSLLCEWLPLHHHGISVYHSTGLLASPASQIISCISVATLAEHFHADKRGLESHPRAWDLASRAAPGRGQWKAEDRRKPDSKLSLSPLPFKGWISHTTCPEKFCLAEQVCLMLPCGLL